MDFDQFFCDIYQYRIFKVYTYFLYIADY